ncbi:GNAT family N-acetyltransferase [Flexivirga aerilata]|uniref:GNAT family N-acetyltransferase n=1 Tax=Flexivirga aerilata TaxID=1656889 RepID=UPI001BB123FA
MTVRRYPEALRVDDTLSLRPATDADAELISGWTQAPEVHEGWGGTPLSVAEVLAKYTGRRAPRVASYLVVEGAEPVGYLQAWQDESACGLDLFIAAPAQGRGIGPRVARALAVALDALGWRPLTVDPAVGNERAVRAWQAAGFVMTGQQGVDHGRPTHLMVFGGG